MEDKGLSYVGKVITFLVFLVIAYIFEFFFTLDTLGLLLINYPLIITLLAIIPTVLMTIGAYQVVVAPPSPGKKTWIFILLGIQVVVTILLSWSVFFLDLPIYLLNVPLILNWILMIPTTYLSFKVRKSAGYWMFVSFIWITLSAIALFAGVYYLTHNS